MNKLITASLVMGLLGAGLGAFVGIGGGEMLINFSRHLQDISFSSAYSISGAVPGFLACFFFSSLYLKKMRYDMGEHRLGWGTLFGGIAGVIIGFIWSVCTGLFLHEEIGATIFLSLFGAMTGFFIGIFIAFFITLIFGPFFIPRIIKEPV